MNLAEIGDAIAETLPELSDDLENYHLEWAPDEPGAYNISCDVLCPALESWLGAPDRTDQVHRAFSLLEQLALEPDQEVHFWVNDMVSWLVQKDEWLAAAAPYLGPQVQRLVRQHEAEIRSVRSRRWWRFWQ